MSNKSFSEFLKEEEIRLVKEDDVVDGETIDDTVEIFFNDLSEEKQKSVMTSLVNALNATEEDDYAVKKITEQLSDKPIMVIKGNQLKNQLGIRI